MSEDKKELLSTSVEIITCMTNHVVVEEDSMDRNYLFIVLAGCVRVTQRSVENDRSCDFPEEVEMHKAYSGGILGQLQVITSEPSFFTYK